MQEKKTTKAQKNFHEWMSRQKITVQKVSFDLKTNYQLVWGWLNGKGRPTIDNAIKIEDLTDGVVCCRDWTIFLSENPHKSKKDSHQEKNTAKRKQCRLTQK